MLTRVLSALLIASATRYGSLPPGSTSSSLASIPRAIDGDIRVSTVTKTDDVAFRTSILPIFVGAGTCNTAAADVYVNATTTTNDSVNPFPCAIDGDCLASTARANDVVLRTSTLPIFVGAGTYSGRPPDPGPIPTLNTSMVERFLLELLIYLGFENLRRPLSIHGTIALVCRLWLRAQLLSLTTSASFCRRIRYTSRSLAPTRRSKMLTPSASLASPSPRHVCCLPPPICHPRFIRLRCKLPCGFTTACQSRICGNLSAYFILTRRQPSLQDLYTFGCLCAVVVPLAQGFLHD